MTSGNIATDTTSVWGDYGRMVMRTYRGGTTLTKLGNASGRVAHTYAVDGVLIRVTSSA